MAQIASIERMRCKKAVRRLDCVTADRYTGGSRDGKAGKLAQNNDVSVPQRDILPIDSNHTHCEQNTTANQKIWKESFHQRIL